MHEDVTYSMHFTLHVITLKHYSKPTYSIWYVNKDNTVFMKMLILVQIKWINSGHNDAEYRCCDTVFHDDEECAW
jgi:hypothetical protein